MTRPLGPEEWGELEQLWDAARGMTPEEREEMLGRRGVNDALRAELESLLAHADTGEVFFDRLKTAVARRQPSAELSPSDSLVGRTIGHYEIVARIGAGGMGVVYRAVDQRLRRPVALKILRSDAHDPRATNSEKLLVEARAVAALDHQNICTIYEVGETATAAAEDRVPFIAMAFYPGETLEQVLRRRRLPLSTCVEYATQIARGLAAAHERGIVHRDVKPANIVVTSDGVLKLLDFGIARTARTADGAASREGITPGTIAYMSPEQLTGGGRTLDRRTDLWSLGVVLYEMCTGTRPFTGDNAGAIMYAILHASPPPPSSLAPELPPSLDALIDRLLVKDPARRHERAEDVTRELAAISGGDASLVRKQLARRIYRRAVWYGVPLLAVLALVAWWPGRAAPALSERRIAAQDLYDQGNRDVLFRTENGRKQAIALFRQAIAVDSTYATAHAGLAHLLVVSGEEAGGSRREQLELAERSARAAVALDSLHAESRAALGHVMLSDFRFAAAEAELQRAIELDRTQPYVRELLVWLSIFTERPEAALLHARRGLEEHPGSPTAIAEVARALLVNGRCAEALEMLKRLDYLQPPPARVPHIAAQCHAQRGMWRAAIDGLEPVAELNPVLTYPLYGFLLARAGDRERARRIQSSLIELRNRGSTGAYGVAVIHAGLGDFDQAFDWLDKAIEDRSLRYNIMEPVFADLRRDPRFERVRRKLALSVTRP
jgi:tetratricopeptide (TPR) repeat protein